MKVVHCKKSPYDVYIGRPSIFGNPFSHKEGTLAEFVCPTREAAIAAYESWFYKRIKEDPSFKAEVLKLKGKVLGCWCSPLPCHGDIIVEYLQTI